MLTVVDATFGIYFYATYFEETVYVTGKQEIETGELYQFGGCTSLPCSTEADNGKFYLKAACTSRSCTTPRRTCSRTSRRRGRDRQGFSVNGA